MDEVGNTVSLSNCHAFIDETFEMLKNKKVGLVRADSGFFSNEYMKYFEEKKINYITAARFYKPIKKEVLYEKKWVELSGWAGHNGMDV
jgi:hypothetical protein